MALDSAIRARPPSRGQTGWRRYRVLRWEQYYYAASLCRVRELNSKQEILLSNNVVSGLMHVYCTATATALAGGKPASHAMRVEEMIAGISGTLSRRHGIAHVRLVFDPASAAAAGVKDLDLRLLSRASSSYKTFFFDKKPRRFPFPFLFAVP